MISKGCAVGRIPAVVVGAVLAVATVLGTAPAASAAPAFGIAWQVTRDVNTVRIHQTDFARYQGYIATARRYMAGFCPTRRSTSTRPK
jgi:hypothetical protein